MSHNLLSEHIKELTEHIKNLIEDSKNIVKYEKNPDELQRMNNNLIDKYLMIQDLNELSKLWVKIHHRLYIAVPKRIEFLRM